MCRKQIIVFSLFLLSYNISIFALDSSRLTSRLLNDSIKFYDGQDFIVIGKFHNEKNYVRLPLKYKTTVRNEVWELSQNSAGIAIRFRSNATDIIVKWTIMLETNLPHMAATGVKGIDLYANVNGVWQFVQSGRPKEKINEYVMLQQGNAVYREYLLNLPLYDGVESLSIGVNSAATVSLPKENYLVNKKPVVYYGSSIVQGGCAIRPGMAFTNILSRKLDRGFINFGFSGEGTFDVSVGKAMCETNAALYVIDCNPNTEQNLIYEKSIQLVKQLKKCKPNVPVLLVENYLYANGSIMPERPFTADGKRKEMRDGKRKELVRAFEILKKFGITNIYYQKSDGLIGNDNEATVDGVHPNDLGMMRIANNLLPQIKKILKNN